ncbi:MAG: TetR/AcrR family transcriptional regulator [Myxococcales bacterium]|nr:TetR/AcrR family transcriptional regulator [Myxococcales bacterium]
MPKVSSKRSRSRPRGRPAGGSDELVRRILDATLELLGASGLAALKVDDVARAANVNKTSVYRRWPTKADLVLAAIEQTPEPPVPFRETGDVRADLTRLLRKKAKVLAQPQAVGLARALAAIDDDSTRELARTLRARSLAPLVEVIENAVARGELAADTRAELLAELLLAPLTNRAVMLGLPIEPTLVDDVIAQLLPRGQG